MTSQRRKSIVEAIAEMPTVNHHEHAWKSFNAEQGEELDLPHFLCQGYLGGDLQAAGFGKEADVVDRYGSIVLLDDSDAAWEAVRPYLPTVRSTSYFRYLLRALWDLFGIREEDIFSEHWRSASERIRAYSRQHRGKGADLCARMGVTATILDAKLGPAELPVVDAGAHRIVHVARMDMFIHEERDLALTLQQFPAHDFEEWLAAFDSVFQRSLEAGAAGFKCGLAYNRRIEFSDPSKQEAARIFEAGILEASPPDRILYQDFMVQRLCQRCVVADVPLQIHTGLHAGMGHLLEEARPTLLNELFRRHPGLKVDLFHGGYPWTREAGLMAKYFPNVYVNGCWLTHIAPSAYRVALTEWIETVPANKILAWGGDHNILEQTYASLLLAKDLVADVLADLVERGYFDVELALHVARRILHDNGCEFWGIET